MPQLGGLSGNVRELVHDNHCELVYVTRKLGEIIPETSVSVYQIVNVPVITRSGFHEMDLQWDLDELERISISN